ncbi:MAG: protein kinase domain-containing protein, partial [Planctomyces sp.]
IGSGGMGIVLKAFDTELHRVVAIKVLKPHLAHNGAARRRFAREAQSAAAVVHEHVTPIHDVLSDGETPFLVMQYVPGQSLQARVDERGPLPVVEILRIARQAAAGLGAAHAQGVVHRDVKPGNILLEESIDRVLISDFGLARTVDDATLTRTGVVAGTPHYMSPEQASGLPVDQRSDLYSLGSVIYFMCTGRPPFRAEHALAVLNRICHDRHHPVEDINSDVPAELADIVDCLLSKNPHDRFRDAGEVEQRLATLLLELQHGRRSSLLHWKRLWRRHREGLRRVSVITAGVLASVLIGMGIAGWFSGRDEITRPTTQSKSQKTSSAGPSVVTGSPIVSEPTATELLIPTEPVTPREEVLVARVSALPDKIAAPNKDVVAAPQIELPPDTFDQDLQKIHELLEKMGTGVPPAPFPAQTDSFNTISTDHSFWTEELNRVREQLP